jgi:hypothetical protein
MKRTTTLLLSLLVLGLSTGTQAQTPNTLTLTGPQSARPGTPITLEVVLSAPAQPPGQPSGLQWTATLPSTWTVTPQAGPAATAAQKDLYCSTPPDPACLVVGLNATPILSGTLATYTLTLPPATPRGPLAIPLGDLVAGDSLGTPIPVTPGVAYTLLILARHDLNGDGVTNTVDLLLMLDQILRRAPCTDDQNGDGRCDLIDALLVIRGALEP